MKRLAVIFATLALAACQAQAPAPRVEVGAPCFDLEIPGNSRVEIIAPRFTNPHDGVPNGDAPAPIDVHVAGGAEPLVLALFGGQEWRLSGATERVSAVLTDIATITGAAPETEVIAYADTRADRRSPHAFSADDGANKRCLRWLSTFSRPEMLAAADQRVFELFGRHLSNFQTGLDRMRFDAGLPDWQIQAARLFADEYVEIPNLDRERAQRIESEAFYAEARRGRAIAHPAHGCDDSQACRALLRWTENGDIRIATNADFRRWQSAARRRPAGRLWTPTIRSYPHQAAYVVQREIRLPDGFAGAGAVVFFLEPGVPAPRGARNHNIIARFEDGSLAGAFYATPD